MERARKRCSPGMLRRIFDTRRFVVDLPPNHLGPMAEARLTVASGTLVETTGWSAEVVHSRHGNLSPFGFVTVRSSPVVFSRWLAPQFSSIWWTSRTGSSDVTGITRPVGGSGIRASAILAGRDPIFMGVSGGLPRRSSTTNAKMPRREGTPHNALIVRHVVEQAIGAKLSGELLDGQRRQKFFGCGLGKLGARAGAVFLRVSRFAAHFRLPN